MFFSFIKKAVVACECYSVEGITFFKAYSAGTLRGEWFSICKLYTDTYDAVLLWTTTSRGITIKKNPHYKIITNWQKLLWSWHLVAQLSMTEFWVFVLIGCNWKSLHDQRRPFKTYLIFGKVFPGVIFSPSIWLAHTLRFSTGGQQLQTVKKWIFHKARYFH